MARGFLYLVVIMDWVSRVVLAWRLSNTLDAEFCVEALEEVLARYAKPEIFNTDQGSQFTGGDFTGTLKRHEITNSMSSAITRSTGADIRERVSPGGDIHVGVATKSSAIRLLAGTTTLLPKLE